VLPKGWRREGKGGGGARNSQRKGKGVPVGEKKKEEFCSTHSGEKQPKAELKKPSVKREGRLHAARRDWGITWEGKERKILDAVGAGKKGKGNKRKGAKNSGGKKVP